MKSGLSYIIGDEDCTMFSLQTHAAGPPGSLPLTDEMQRHLAREHLRRGPDTRSVECGSAGIAANPSDRGEGVTVWQEAPEIAEEPPS
jgi:hypothetical protein